MIEIPKAVYAKYSELPHNAFYNMTGGRLYQGRAIKDAIFPYAVFNFPSISEDDTFTETIDDVFIQFDLYSSMESSAESWNLLSACRNLFNDSTFPVTGYSNNLYLRRELQVPPYKEEETETAPWKTVIEFRGITGD